MSGHARGKWLMKTGQNRSWLGIVVALPPLVDEMFMQQKFKYGRSGHNLKTVLTIHMAYFSKTHDTIRDIIIFFFGWKKNYVETPNIVPILILGRQLLVLWPIFLCKHFPSLLCFGDEKGSCFPANGAHFLFYLETIQPHHTCHTTVSITLLSVSSMWACEDALTLCTGIDAHWPALTASWLPCTKVRLEGQ